MSTEGSIQHVGTNAIQTGRTQQAWAWIQGAGEVVPKAGMTCLGPAEPLGQSKYQEPIRGEVQVRGFSKHLQVVRHLVNTYR